MNGIPLIETERLVLRAHREDDLDALTDIWNQPDVYRFTRSRPSTREEIWQAVLRHRGTWAMFGFGYFVVEEKTVGKPVGEVGMQERKRDLQPSIEGTLEAGWAFDARSHGKGYALEAMRAVLAWCDGAHPGKASSCIIDPENASSLALAAKLGFVETARCIYLEKPVVILRRQAVFTR